MMARLPRPDAARRERMPIPGVVPNDAVGLGDDVPAFDIGELYRAQGLVRHQVWRRGSSAGLR